MILYNRLFLEAYVKVNKFFQQQRIDYYPTSIGVAYKEVFNRDTFACLSFLTKHNPSKHMYLYFNASYNADINRMVFSSIAVVSRETLNRKHYSYELKKHVEDMKDVETFLQSLEGMI